MISLLCSSKSFAVGATLHALQSNRLAAVVMSTRAFARLISAWKGVLEALMLRTVELDAPEVFAISHR